MDHLQTGFSTWECLPVTSLTGIVSPGLTGELPDQRITRDSFG
ncbi:hypothetical Protein YC6258_04668 [Gynuella sunshinyii YC6258]|uniref:Uncharacterized protein n=1 Tax=Gynuella sunshinyii YC6258 TaxID=1445510 RepID=A0A0C5VBI0_9GAMM|nr:hypothetical Protein YC6258_04668 [Gynuella sunshinyii YC6258]